jgi:hypothetical protein
MSMSMSMIMIMSMSMIMNMGMDMNMNSYMTMYMNRSSPIKAYKLIQKNSLFNQLIKVLTRQSSI